MSKEEEVSSNSMLYLLAGVGLGAIIGAAAGLLLAPKAGDETRDDLLEKYGELKAKTQDWVTDQRAKRMVQEAIEEVGA